MSRGRAALGTLHHAVLPYGNGRLGVLLGGLGPLGQGVVEAQAFRAEPLGGPHPDAVARRQGIDRHGLRAAALGDPTCLVHLLAGERAQQIGRVALDPILV